MPAPNDTVRLQIRLGGDAELPRERVTELAASLRERLRELRVEPVPESGSGPPSPAGKSLSDHALDAMVITAALQTVRAVIRMIEQWTTQAPPRTTVRLEVERDGDSTRLVLPDASGRERARLLDLLADTVEGDQGGHR